MTSALRLALCFFCKYSGLNAVFRRINRNRVLILWYHGVSDKAAAALRGYDERHISSAVFQTHLRRLRRWGYRFATLDEIAASARSGKPLNKAAVLTFDDGFHNVTANALPLMEEANAKAIMYVVVSCARTSEGLWTDQVEGWILGQKEARVRAALPSGDVEYSLASLREKRFAMRDLKRRLRALPDTERAGAVNGFRSQVAPEFRISSFPELKAIDPTLMEIGSHTETHPNCTQLSSAAEFDRELGGSKSELEAALGRPVKHFAYPAGRYDNRVVDEVRKQGYLTAVTTDAGLNGANCDLFRLKRVGTNASLLMFDAMASGSYFFFTGWLKPFRASR
jgi:peptidoglycan/xylan/chitin deacetylase (PgdA/CDA1 family)